MNKSCAKCQTFYSVRINCRNLFDQTATSQLRIPARQHSSARVGTRDPRAPRGILEISVGDHGPLGRVLTREGMALPRRGLRAADLLRIQFLRLKACPDTPSMCASSEPNLISIWVYKGELSVPWDGCYRLDDVENMGSQEARWISVQVDLCHLIWNRKRTTGETLPPETAEVIGSSL